MQITQSPLLSYLRYPRIPEANFALGRWYQQLGHDSPAISFFIRAAEFAEEMGFDGNEELLLLAYEALIRAHACVNKHRTREHTAKSLLQRSISLVPYRPEAYYLLGKMEQNKQNWVEAYTLNSIGYNLALSVKPLPSAKEWGYFGDYSFLLPLALSAYHWGRGTEARKILQEIVNEYKYLLPSNEMDMVGKFITKWGVGDETVADVPYIRKFHKDDFRYPFKDLEIIEKNYSQAYQDMFVLSVLDGKKNGTYLEIGSEDPEYKSNTCLLERDFKWIGISIEIDAPEVNRFNSLRKNKAICFDATKVDYERLLKKANFPEEIDYLQIDTEPSSTSFETLLSIPFDKYAFKVITFEHDYAVDVTRSYREKSRRYLRSLGYELIVPDIGPTDWYPFEDWWVKPELVDMDRLRDLGMVVESTPETGANDVKNYFLV